MALCVGRLRGAPALGGRWRSGVRGAGGAAGRLREAGRVQDTILYRELRPCPRVDAPLRRPVALTRTAQSPRPPGIRLSSPAAELDRALRDMNVQCKLPTLPVSRFPPSAKRRDPPYPLGREYGYLSGAQLDCFRSLFEPGVCRTPYQALELPTPTPPEGLLEFSLSLKMASSPATGSHQSDMEQHLAVMCEKLREELPNFLWKPLNVTLYRRDVELISSMLHLHLRGLVKYQMFMSITRLLLLCYYSNTHVSILKLTSHPETNSIHARWSFTGLPLHCLFLYPFKMDKNSLYRTYDAFSTFHLAPDGLISLHKVEQIMPSSPLTIAKKSILAGALLALGLEENRPALNLLSSPKLPHEL